MMMLSIVLGRAGVGLQVTVEPSIMLGVAPAGGVAFPGVIGGFGSFGSFHGFFFESNFFLKISELFHFFSPIITHSE